MGVNIKSLLIYFLLFFMLVNISIVLRGFGLLDFKL